MKKKFFIIIIAPFILVAGLLLIRLGKEVYLMKQHPEPELYFEDYDAHYDYCNSMVFCIASLVCDRELMDCPAGCIVSCSPKAGSTKGLSR